MHDHVIETERLRLVPKKEEHTAASWHAIERSMPELKRFMAWAHFASPLTTAEHMRAAEAEWAEWRGWDWVSFLGDEVAGSIGLNRYDAMWKTCDLGYWIRSDLAGQGLATEAGRAAIEFAFDEVPVQRVELIAAVENVASNRVATKLGFRFEGIKRSGLLVDGKGLDARFYGLLSTDPRPGI